MSNPWIGYAKRNSGFPKTLIDAAEDRIEKRRGGRTYIVGNRLHVEFPKDWVTMSLRGYMRRHIVIAIENKTYGEWAISYPDRLIGFEDPNDLILFAMGCEKGA
jgi:hypothetical protein